MKAKALIIFVFVFPKADWWFYGAAARIVRDIAGSKFVRGHFKKIYHVET